MKMFTGAAVAAVLFAVSPASAGVLVNRMPTGTLYQSSYTNESAGQNFLVQFTLAQASNVTGFEFLQNDFFPQVGEALRIKIRADVAGSPAAANLFSFTDQVDAVSAYGTNVALTTTNFAPILLAAGTYWMGASGEGNTQTWATYNNGGPISPSYQRQLVVDAIQSQPSIYDLAFNVLGDPAVTAGVPEPATWAMMIVGFGLVGVSLRRKVRTTVRFA